MSRGPHLKSSAELLRFAVSEDVQPFNYSAFPHNDRWEGPKNRAFLVMLPLNTWSENVYCYVSDEAVGSLVRLRVQHSLHGTSDRVCQGPTDVRAQATTRVRMVQPSQALPSSDLGV